MGVTCPRGLPVATAARRLQQQQQQQYWSIPSTGSMSQRREACSLSKPTWQRVTGRPATHSQPQHSTATNPDALTVQSLSAGVPRGAHRHVRGDQQPQAGPKLACSSQHTHRGVSTSRGPAGGTASLCAVPARKSPPKKQFVSQLNETIRQPCQTLPLTVAARDHDCHCMQVWHQ